MVALAEDIQARIQLGKGSANSTIGRARPRTLINTFEHVMYANAANMITRLQDCCNLFPFHNKFGVAYPWTSSSHYPSQKGKR